MISKGIRPENILLFTFTKKAANELKERIESSIGVGSGVTVSTYHSFCCNRILRKYSEHIGYKSNFSIYDEADKLSLLKKIIEDESILAETAATYISNWKNQMIFPAKAIEKCENRTRKDKSMAKIYKEYQDKMRDMDCVDFDDLIFLSVHLLQNHHDIKEVINNKYQYIMSDEHHDASIRDLELVRLLAGDNQNICMIMDDEQSIYRFRGSNIDAVIKSKENFKDCKEFILKQNYRSTQTIVNASRSLIKNNQNQIDKDLFSENEVGDKLLIVDANNTAEEANKILAMIKVFKAKGVENNEIAVLYRASYLSKPIEDALLKNAIPYEIVGGTSFYQRKEIKDLMAYFSFANNTLDEESFMRAIKNPKRGLGDKTIEKIIEASEEFGLLEACNVENVKLRGGAQSNSLNEFYILIKEIKSMVDNRELPETILRHIITTLDYNKKLLENEKLGAGEDRVCNVIELINIASQYEEVQDFIYGITLNNTQDETLSDLKKIQLLTMHASKGLEFKVVFIIGANEGQYPHWRSLDNPKQLEEDRRLFYVGMTRAEKHLIITRPKVVLSNGRKQTTKESRYLKEIDRQYVKRV